MDEQAFQDALREILESLEEQDCISDLEVRRVSTFEEAGVMTRNAGLVVRLRDNSVFQVTIVQDHRGW